MGFHSSSLTFIHDLRIKLRCADNVCQFLFMALFLEVYTCADVI